MNWRIEKNSGRVGFLITCGRNPNDTYAVTAIYPARPGCSVLVEDPGKAYNVVSTWDGEGELSDQFLHVDAPPVEERGAMCPKCGNTYTSVAGVRAHVRRMHNG